jgi:hypothetical protein
MLEEVPVILSILRRLLLLDNVTLVRHHITAAHIDAQMLFHHGHHLAQVLGVGTIMAGAHVDLSHDTVVHSDHPRRHDHATSQEGGMVELLGDLRGNVPLPQAFPIIYTRTFL